MFLWLHIKKWKMPRYFKYDISSRFIPVTDATWDADSNGGIFALRKCAQHLQIIFSCTVQPCKYGHLGGGIESAFINGVYVLRWLDWIF